MRSRLCSQEMLLNALEDRVVDCDVVRRRQVDIDDMGECKPVELLRRRWSKSRRLNDLLLRSSHLLRRKRLLEICEFGEGAECRGHLCDDCLVFARQAIELPFNCLDA